MKFIPILFSTPMVQAILDGRKTQTRRVIKGFTAEVNGKYINFEYKTSKLKMSVGNVTFKNLNKPFLGIVEESPYGVPGDILWVRETWHEVKKSNFNRNIPYLYKASSHETKVENYKWKPSIFMPKQACRLFLKVVSVRVERLQDISEEDAISEGVKMVGNLYNNYSAGYQHFGVGNLFQYAKKSFASLWESINGEESWNSNPWVWVLEFCVIDKPSNF